jgi:hypothetical protein
MRTYEEYDVIVKKYIGVFQLESDGYWRILLKKAIETPNKKLHFEESELFLVNFIGEPVDKKLVNLFLEKGVLFAIKKLDFFFYTKEDAIKGLDIMMDYGYRKEMQVNKQ